MTENNISFSNFSLPETLSTSIERLGYKSPTPIQKEAIPIILREKDLLGSAQTGTGKTAAFAIPLIARLIKDPHISALILTPTRELAKQVNQVFKDLLVDQKRFPTVLLVGGEFFPKQLKQLRLNPRIIVGTPGRVNDHLNRKTLSLHNTEILVLDETDRMLDMGFGIQLESILQYFPRRSQTLMFSATLPPKITQLAKKYLNEPVQISIGATNMPAPKIQQDIIHIKEKEKTKYQILLEQLKKREGSIIVFVNTRNGAEMLAKKLKYENHSAEVFHGNLQQRNRERVMNAFRNKNFRIMVATDIAARGIDIPHIQHVINYELPMCPEDYIHRIGRTARATATGLAVSLISKSDNKRWKAIERLMHAAKNKQK